MLDKDNCGMHEVQTVKDCCKKDKSKSPKAIDFEKETCCTDGYLFAISAKFGGIQVKQIQIPIGSFNLLSSNYISYNYTISLTHFITYHQPPPELPAGMLASNCVWLI